MAIDPLGAPATRFVVVVSEKTPVTVRDAMTLALHALRSVFWLHRFQHSWLIVDPLQRSAAYWREFFMGVTQESKNVQFLVLECGPDFAGLVGKETADWMHAAWTYVGDPMAPPPR